MSAPTESEVYAQLIEHLRKAQEHAAMMGHLIADHDKLRSHGFLGISELLGRACTQVTQLAMRKMN